MTTMVEALADRYKVHLSADDLADLQANRTRSTFNCPMGTTVPSKRQNRIKSGRASRRAANTQRALRAVGGISGHWTRAALKPATYEMCKVVTKK